MLVEQFESAAMNVSTAELSTLDEDREEVGAAIIVLVFRFGEIIFYYLRLRVVVTRTCV